MHTDDTPAAASTGPAAGATALLRVLVDYRLAVYLGGLAVIATPTLLEYAGVSVALSTRRLIVGLSLATMVVTYLGERRFVHGEGGDGERRAGEAFGWRTRLALVGAIAGIALGVYVAFAVDLLYGAVFVVGAYLFAQLAVRSRGERDG